MTLYQQNLKFFKNSALHIYNELKKGTYRKLLSDIVNCILIIG